MFFGTMPYNYGMYIGKDGIALGANSDQSGPGFSVTKYGDVTILKGTIGNNTSNWNLNTGEANITKGTIGNAISNWNITSGIVSLTKGDIGNSLLRWNIDSGYMSRNRTTVSLVPSSSADAAYDGCYLGYKGLSYGQTDKRIRDATVAANSSSRYTHGFYVQQNGTTTINKGTIGGWTISDHSLTKNIPENTLDENGNITSIGRDYFWKKRSDFTLAEQDHYNNNPGAWKTIQIGQDTYCIPMGRGATVVSGLAARLYEQYIGEEGIRFGDNFYLTKNGSAYFGDISIATSSNSMIGNYSVAKINELLARVENNL